MNIKLKNIFLVLTGFQITWLSCVFGEYYEISLFGFFIGILYLLFFFYFKSNKIKALNICIIISLVGYLFDTILGFSQLFVINSKVIVGFLPIWFLVLWPSFATLFVDVFSFLKNRSILALLLGSFMGPPTYYFGIILGIAKSNDVVLTITIMAIFWGLLFYLYSIYLKKIN